MPHRDEHPPPTTPASTPSRRAGGITTAPARVDAAGITALPDPAGGRRDAPWV